MKTFTVIAETEYIGRLYPNKAIKNSAGQFVLYDGNDQHGAELAFDLGERYFEDVALFSGSKSLGKIIKSTKYVSKQQGGFALGID